MSHPGGSQRASRPGRGQRSTRATKMSSQDAGEHVFASLYGNGRPDGIRRTVPEIMEWVHQHRGVEMNFNQVWSGINYIRRTNRREILIADRHAENSTYRLALSPKDVRDYTEDLLRAEGPKFVNSYQKLKQALATQHSHHDRAEQLTAVLDAVERVIRAVHSAHPRPKEFADLVVERTCLGPSDAPLQLDVLHHVHATP